MKKILTIVMCSMILPSMFVLAYAQHYYNEPHLKYDYTPYCHRMWEQRQYERLFDNTLDRESKAKAYHEWHCSRKHNKDFCPECFSIILRDRIINLEKRVKELEQKLDARN